MTAMDSAADPANRGATRSSMQGLYVGVGFGHPLYRPTPCCDGSKNRSRFSEHFLDLILWAGSYIDRDFTTQRDPFYSVLPNGPTMQPL